MLRVRFKANAEDYRPVKAPAPLPFWCTGYGDDYAIVVAYADTQEQVTEYWPEAEDIEILEENAVITFSGRFPKPDWWRPNEPA